MASQPEFLAQIACERANVGACGTGHGHVKFHNGLHVFMRCNVGNPSIACLLGHDCANKFHAGTIAMRVAVTHLPYVELFDGHRTCLKFHILTFTRQIIGALAVDLNGGVDVRYLFDTPCEPFCDQLFHGLTRGKARCPLPRQQLAFGIVRGGALPKANGGLIRFVMVDNVVEQSRGIAESDH